jgi:hypothetical protein
MGARFCPSQTTGSPGVANHRLSVIVVDVGIVALRYRAQPGRGNRCHFVPIQRGFSGRFRIFCGVAHKPEVRGMLRKLRRIKW